MTILLEEAKRIEAGRLAFRIEGETWVAYWVPQADSMKGAVILGSIKMKLVRSNPKVKNAFMDTIKLAFSEMTLETVGAESNFPETKVAPEYERSKS